MNGIEVTRAAFEFSHRWFTGTIADLTPELTNFVSPGKVHPIGELVTHVVNAEDYFINERIRQEKPLWEQEGWGEKLGLPFVLHHEEQAAREFRCDIAALQPYIDAVFSATTAHLATMHDADLDRLISTGPLGDMRVGEVAQFFIIGNT